jgi:hypothetical protein
MSNGNDPAFPGETEYFHGKDEKTGTDIWDRFSGLTKREWMAALCLQGMLTDFGPDKNWIREQAAKEAIAFADALLAELKGGE